jgi:hypothetical protein
MDGCSWYVLGARADELMVLAGGEHDDGDLRVAEHGELLGLPWINTVCALMVGLVELH